MGVPVAELEDLVGHGTAGDADDEFQHKSGDGVARVTGQDIGQSQTNGTGQTAGDAIQQQSRQGRKGVAQMERGAAVERDAEEQVSHKAQSGHHAGQGQLVDGKGALVQHTGKDDQDHNDCQQQPHYSGRHQMIPSNFKVLRTCRGGAPLSCLARPFVSLQSPTGALIASQPLTHRNS